MLSIHVNVHVYVNNGVQALTCEDGGLALSLLCNHSDHRVLHLGDT